MNEAPKKIWMSTDAHAWAIEDDIFNLPYIRADLVAGLVEALGDLIKGGESMGWESVIKVIIALKALEEG
jgi:hypothetical protein